MSVLEDLRRATGPAHAALEAGLDIVGQLRTPAGAREMLGGFYRLYAAAEPRLGRELAAVDGLRFEARRKLPALAADLRVLGADAAMIAPAPEPQLAGRAHALGFAYVLEGATLGGRVIQKQLAGRGLPAAGLSFFGFYGAATGERWREFCAVLERECEGSSAEAVGGARLGFAYMTEGLIGADAD